MSSGQVPIAAPFSPEARELLGRFESLWPRQRPAIDDFLAASPAGERLAVLVELAHAELEFRLRTGEAARVEDYLTRFPELADRPAVVAGLLAAEFRLRCRRDPTHDPDTYRQRFPAHAAFIDRLAQEQPAKGRGMHPTPVSLLESLREPEPAPAWGRFVEIYTPLLYRWARRLGCPEQDAADLVQEVFALLVRKLPAFRYNPQQSFRAWLRTVTRNCWNNQRRRAELPRAAGAPDPAGLADPDPPDPFWETEYRQQLVGRALRLMQTEFRPTT